MGICHAGNGSFLDTESAIESPNDGGKSQDWLHNVMGQNAQSLKIYMDYSIHETSDDGTIGYCPCTYDPSIMLILFHTISCYL